MVRGGSLSFNRRLEGRMGGREGVNEMREKLGEGWREEGFKGLTRRERGRGMWWNTRWEDGLGWLYGKGFFEF